jgi:hypothetical protein
MALQDRCKNHYQKNVTLFFKHTLMDSNQDFPEKFVPRGAVFFFALLVALGLIIWFTIYFIMLYRS